MGKEQVLSEYLASISFAARNDVPIGIFGRICQVVIAGPQNQGLLGQLGPVGSVGIQGVSNAELAKADVERAYARAAAVMQAAEAEAGARVGPLRTAPPVPTANILRGMR